MGPSGGRGGMQGATWPGGVAWFLSKALDRGLQCVPCCVPRWELNASDAVEGTCLHFATSRELPDAALALGFKLQWQMCTYMRLFMMDICKARRSRFAPPRGLFLH